MRVYEFPFERIQNAFQNQVQGYIPKIIIYGGGNVGKQYVAQCRAKKYAEILCVLDSQILLFSAMQGVCTKLPQAIKEFADDAYDYVVIAIENKDHANVMKNTLLEFGVEEEKIIYDIKYYDSVKSLYDPDIKLWFRPTFSWFGEDLIAYGIFRSLGLDTPSYLDIGCNHPMNGNNTALFYLTGSHGINIDANKDCIEAMKKERPEDQNLCLGVMTESGENTFYMIEGNDALNSFSLEYIEEYYTRHCTGGGKIDSTNKVECQTLEDIIQGYCNGIFPDFFDLDIEGLDADVIQSFDFSRKGPTVICVESKDAAMNQHLFRCGYVKYFETPHNEIFVKKTSFHKLVEGNL